MWFVVQTTNHLYIERVSYGEEFWEEVLPKLQSFYFDAILLELASLYYQQCSIFEPSDICHGKEGGVHHIQWLKNGAQASVSTCTTGDYSITVQNIRWSGIFRCPCFPEATPSKIKASKKISALLESWNTLLLYAWYLSPYSCFGCWEVLSKC